MGLHTRTPQPSSLLEKEGYEHELDTDITEFAEGDALADLRAGTEVGQLEPRLHSRHDTNAPDMTLSVAPESAQWKLLETDDRKQRTPRRKQ